MVSDLRGWNKAYEKDYVHSKALTKLFMEVQADNPTMYSKMDVKSAFFAICTSENTNDTTTFYADCGRHLNSRGNSDTGRYKYNRLIMGANHQARHYRG